MHAFRVPIRYIRSNRHAGGAPELGAAPLNRGIGDEADGQMGYGPGSAVVQALLVTGKELSTCRLPSRPRVNFAGRVARRR